jgi:serine/threonine protein kinase, bacterial
VVEGAGGSRVGSWFGRYELGRLLGRGGFGEVYEARDSVMGRQVALKLLAGAYSGDPVFRERLFREAHAAGRLREPHIVPIHGCGEIDGQLFIDMRLIEGKDLDAVLGACVRLEPARAVAIVSQIAAALDAAHAEGMVHRDIKPGNILITDTDFAYLVDFGLANAATDPKLTSTGMTIGTFAYLAPERLTNTGIGGGVDIYALACVLFKCLTGQTPYRGDIPALISAHLSAPIPRPSEYDPTLPAGLDAVIATGMAKSAHQRYPSATELAAAAYHALNSAEQHQADTIAHPTTAAPSRPTSPWSTPPTPADHPTMHRPPGYQLTLPPAHRPTPTPQSRNRYRTAITIAAIATAIIATAAITVAVTHHNTETTSSSTTPAPGQSPTTTTPSATLPADDRLIQLPFSGLAEPTDVAVDTAGNVYVADPKKYHLLKLAAGTNVPAELSTGFNQPQGIALGAETVYVTDHDNNRVLQLSGDKKTWTPLPFADLYDPSGLAVDTTGTLYVTDTQHGRLLKMTPGATAATAIATPDMTLPVGVALDTKGNLYVVGYNVGGAGAVLEWPSGATEPVTLPIPGLSHPQRVAVDTASNVYVTDTDHNRVVKLTAGSTNLTELPFGKLNQPWAIAIDPAGNVFLTDLGAKRVLKLPAR